MRSILCLGSPGYVAFICRAWEDYIHEDLDILVQDVGYPINLEKLNFDFVMFTGGEDVDPTMYGHRYHESTSSWKERDIAEKLIFKYCLINKKPMIGICRGSQFLWAMCGGKLFQDVGNHGATHTALDLKSATTYRVNSTHHQMADISTKPEKVEVLAVSSPTISPYHVRYNVNANDFENIDNTPEVEAWTLASRKILGIQWHPEMRTCPTEGKALAVKYVMETLNG